jgi:hypothetical protein
MFGTLALHGFQETNVFVSDFGKTYKIINSWTPIGYKFERYVLLRKYNDEYWWLMRCIDISY